MTITKNWRQHLLGTANSFAKDDRGNIAIMTAAMLVGITLFTGGSLDLYKYETNRKRVQDVLDRCVLSATRLDHNLANSTGASGEREIKKMIYACTDSQGVDLPEEPITVFQIDNDKANGYREINVKSQLSVPTSFLKLASVDDFTINIDTTAAERDTTVEISLVLDMSGSMSSFTDGTTRRVDEMKIAANTFVDALLRRADPGEQLKAQERTSISIVPYSRSVSLGKGMFDIVRDGRRDNDRSSCIYFRNSDFGSNGVPNFKQRDQAVHYGPVTHLYYFDRVGTSWQNYWFRAKNGYARYFENADTGKAFETEIWKCPDDPHAYMVEPYTPTVTVPRGDGKVHYDGTNVTLGNKMTVPLLGSLEDHVIECDRMNRDYSDDTCFNPDPPAQRNAQEAYDAGHLRLDDDDWSMVYASSDPDYLSERIDAYKLNGSTSTQIGMKWAQLLLDPGFQDHFEEADDAGVIDLHAKQEGRPYDYDKPGNFKYIVLMTDGRITQSSKFNGQYYRYDRHYTSSRTHTNENKAIQQFNTVCNLAKSDAKNIRVFTIGFALNDGDPTKDTLRNCASSPSDYFDVSAGGLKQAFENIASTIDSLSLRPV